MRETRGGVKRGRRGVVKEGMGRRKGEEGKG